MIFGWIKVSIDKRDIKYRDIKWYTTFPMNQIG